MRQETAPTRPPTANRIAPADGGDIVSAWLTNLHFDWAEVVRGARTRELAKDETLFLEGQAADTVYVVQQGRIRLTSFGFDGKERHLMIVGANGLAGDCALRSTRKYVVSAVAASDAVVSMVPSAGMLEVLARNPTFAAQHQALSSMRFRIMLRHVAVQGANSSRRRVCLHLLDLVNSYGAPHKQGTVISISFTQQEMGSICGLSRVSVSHIFSQLERDRVITRAGRLVVILDAAQLEVLSRT
jgi:CRP/FNR family transcriptional regulator